MFICCCCVSVYANTVFFCTLQLATASMVKYAIDESFDTFIQKLTTLPFGNSSIQLHMLLKISCRDSEIEKVHFTQQG